MKSGIVVLLGRPNVGKSTLLNAVLKEDLSIVTPKAQTTRDQIRGILNEPRGQVVFIDTPGVHKAKEGGINAFMIQEVKKALDGPDLVIYLIDPMSKVSAERLMLEYLKEASSKLILLVNKADLVKVHAEQFKWLDPWIDEVKQELQGTRCEWIATHSISAVKKKGVKELLQLIFDELPNGEPLYPVDDSLTDRSLRFIVAELIRKQLFMNLGDEIPYSCAVEIESFKENKKPVVIQAMIYVERESQKGMVIGSQGKKIKEIGTAARKEIEKLMGEKVFLELRVKVLAAWTSEQTKLKSLGYELEKRSRK